jgi:hypothetical protein
MQLKVSFSVIMSRYEEVFPENNGEGQGEYEMIRASAETSPGRTQSSRQSPFNASLPQQLLPAHVSISVASWPMALLPTTHARRNIRNKGKYPLIFNFDWRASQSPPLQTCVSFADHSGIVPIRGGNNFSLEYLVGQKAFLLPSAVQFLDPGRPGRMNEMVRMKYACATPVDRR